MIFAVCSEDTFQAKERVCAIEKELGNIRTRVIDCDKESYEALSLEQQGSFLFGESRLLILKNPSQDQSWVKEILSFLKREYKGINLLILEENVDPQLKTLIEEKGKVYRCSFMGEREAAFWVKEKFESYGKKVDFRVAQVLGAEFRKELWGANAIIAQIAAYVGQKPLVLVRDMSLFFKPSFQANVFNTVEAIARKNKKTALDCLSRHFAQGDAALYLLSMLVYQFRILIEVRDLVERGEGLQAIAKACQLKPFVAKKSFEIAQHFSLAELKRLYEKLWKAELLTKTGRILPESALYLFTSGL